MKNLLREQSTHTGVALVVIIALLAHVADIDLVLLTDTTAKNVAAIITLLGLASSAAKIGLPEAPKVDPTLAAAASNLPPDLALHAASSLGVKALRDMADALEKKGKP